MGAGCSSRGSTRVHGAPPPPYSGSNSSVSSSSAANGDLTAHRDNAPKRNAKKTVKVLPPSEVIRKKADEFWNEIKDIKIPDVTSGKSSDEILSDIIEHEKVHKGIDWKAAAQNGKEELEQAIEKAHDHLKAIRNSFTANEVDLGKSMGLLDENGNVPHYDLLAEDTTSTPGLAPIPGSAAPYVVWGWNKKQTEKFQNATGDRIKDLIVNLIRNFQVMENDSTRYLVKTFMEAGLWGLGAVGLKAVWNIVSTLAELSEATEAYAVLEGVVSVGVNLIKLGITTVILAILVPLFIYMTKDAAAIMVIINDTNDDMRLIDLHATHGKVVGIFKENAALDNPKPIIPKKLPPIINPKTKKVVAEGSIQAGFFAGRKRDLALYGTQGALKFDATASYPKGIYLGWEVPLSQGKNCVLLSADYSGSASEFSDKTNDDGTQDCSVVSSKNARATGRVHSGSGSKGYYIISITEPPSLENLLMTPREPTVEEKAAMFYDSMKDIKLPNVTKGKTSDEVINDIIDHENLHHGIDWRAAAKEGSRALKQASEKAHMRLKSIRKTMSEHEVHKAKAMGLLDANGNVPFYDLLGEQAVAESNLAPIPSGAAPYTVWGWNIEHTADFQNATGERIKDLITNLIRNFQVMDQDDERAMVKNFTEAGLWGVGLYGLKAVWRIIATLAELNSATTAYAVFNGVLEVGVNVIKLGIATVIIAILVPLFVYMTKDAAAVMVIINDTDEDLELADVHATHGKIVGIFKESAKLDNPQPIVPKRLPPIINPKTHKVVCKGGIQAGFFAARKHDNALVGTQGAMKFSATSSYPMGICVGWEVPLSQGSNRLLVSASYSGSASQFSDQTNDDGKQEDTAVSSKSAKITGRVHSASGSQGYYVINVTEPPKALLGEASSDVEDLKQKAEKLTEEIKNMKMPDVARGKTPQELISDIIEHEKTHNGIDWEAAAKGGEEELKKAVTKAHQKLNDIRKKMSSKEVENAKAMGLLNAQGEVHEHNFLAAENLGTAPIPDSAAAFSVWAWDVDTAADYQNAKGDRIKELILNLIRNFQVMNQSDERQIVKIFTEIGLWGMGLYGLRAAWKILRTIGDVAARTMAILDGIVEVGVNVIKIGISIVILAVLVPIFIYMNKDAAALMVVINDTYDDLDLEEIHATHGKIVGIFKENAEEKDPKPIIPKKEGPLINEKTGKMIAKGSIQAGFFAARKHDSALVGTQGAFKFTKTSAYPMGVFVGWEVPLSQGSNRLLVSATYGDNVAKFSDKTNDDGKQEDTSVSSNNARVTGRVDSASGDHGYYIINITEPAKLMGSTGNTGENEEEILKRVKSIQIPDVTTGKSTDELINDIMEHEKQEHGIDWRAAVDGGHSAIKDALEKAHGKLRSIRSKMSKEEVNTAISMGLLDSKGEVPNYNLMDPEEEETAQPVTMLAEAASVNTVPIPSTAAPYMVWGWNAEKVAEFEDAAGDAIKQKVLALIRTFQAMKDDDKERYAQAFRSAGLWGIGTVALRATWRILSAASALTEATEVAAIVEGITVIGTSVITLGIATCVLAVLVPLFIFMNKNAAAIMVIINNTDEDMAMVDLHATHGKIVGIFKENAGVDNPKVIIPKKLSPIVNPTTKKVVLPGSIQAGFFAAKKRDSALYGTQGAMKFSPTTRYPNGIYVGWEIPLTLGSNRLLVSADFTGSASEFSNRTNDENRQEDRSMSSTHSTTSAEVSGRVNSSSGSEGYYVISIK